MINKLLILGVLATSISLMNAEKVINVPCAGDDQTWVIQEAFVKASFYKGKNVTIRLEPSTYHLHRDNAALHTYYISNTSFSQENSGRMKHIGVWMRDMENITFDGNGATIITHGEMSPFVIDNCKNIKLINFTLDSADPSVVEITISKTGENFIEFEILPPTKFEVQEDRFYFYGDKWKFGDENINPDQKIIAQIYDPEFERTLRTSSPIQGYTKAEKIDENNVRLFFEDIPKVNPGERYQLRHSLMNEACMLINNSRDIEVNSIDFNFMGNFGAVSQFSENITFSNIHCEPSKESGRTNAGFTDFLQFSSCKGSVKVLNSDFSGSQEDPIIIQGTFLDVMKTDSDNRITVANKDPQTFDFPPFKKGDELAFVNHESLTYTGKTARVDSVWTEDNNNYELILDQKISNFFEGALIPDFAVENLTWTPDVEISGNYFSHTPTRAILITNHRKSIIKDNKFYHIPKASIQVAYDANSWLEPDQITDLIIRNNVFIECKSPVISVSPEIKYFKESVKSNISIIGNRFLLPQAGAININASTDVIIKKNTFEFPLSKNLKDDNFITTDDVTNLKTESNRIIL